MVNKVLKMSELFSSQRSPTEQRILDAARHEFVAKGVGGARLQPIADAAMVNKALLHYYFRSKQKLYEAVLQDIIARFWSSLRQSLAQQPQSDDPQQLIQSMVRTYIGLMRSNPDFPRIFMREVAEGSEHLPQVLKGLLEQGGDFPRFMAATVRSRLANQGLFAELPPYHLMLNILGMCAASIFMRPMVIAMGQHLPEFASVLQDDEFFEERIQAISAMAYQGIFHGESA
jgi:AcrR family transcriptional regulator